jgi:ElaB/YqjD/DUF883 family membrane-anchored ribosome-binding protein
MTDHETENEAVRLAKAELQKAQALYERVCREAAERIETVRCTTVGDLLDGTRNTIRKHPGASLGVALLAGVFLGRLLKR